MTICEKNGIYLIGKDFVDCVSGKYKSEGVFVKSTDSSRRPFQWLSTYNCVDSERIVRKTAKSGGFDLFFFRSQNIEEKGD